MYLNSVAHGDREPSHATTPWRILARQKHGSTKLLWRKTRRVYITETIKMKNETIINHSEQWTVVHVTLENCIQLKENKIFWLVNLYVPKLSGDWSSFLVGTIHNRGKSVFEESTSIDLICAISENKDKWLLSILIFNSTFKLTLFSACALTFVLSWREISWLLCHQYYGTLIKAVCTSTILSHEQQKFGTDSNIIWGSQYMI